MGRLFVATLVLGLGPVFAWTAALDGFLDDAVKGTDTHAALAVAGQSVVACKAVAAVARIGLDARVDLGMALEVVLAYKTLLACGALVLSVVEMCLHVRLDVFLAAKLLAAELKGTCPLAVAGFRAEDKDVDFGSVDASFDAGIVDIERVDAGGADIAS